MSSPSLPPVRLRRHHFAVLQSAAEELRARSAEEDSVEGDIVRRGTRSYLSRPAKFRILPEAAG